MISWGMISHHWVLFLSQLQYEIIQQQHPNHIQRRLKIGNTQINNRKQKTTKKSYRKLKLPVLKLKTEAAPNTRRFSWYWSLCRGVASRNVADGGREETSLVSRSAKAMAFSCVYKTLVMSTRYRDFSIFSSSLQGRRICYQYRLQYLSQTIL